MSERQKTADYQILPSPDGNMYRFYCGCSHITVWTTHPIRAETPEEELTVAWEKEGRSHFNHCTHCGKWVSDLMYNVDTSACVVCSPWEEMPNYCPHCGQPVKDSTNTCPRCGKKLRYPGE